MYKVSFAVPRRDLGRADVSFSVKWNGVKLGTLDVSQGGVVWFPRDKRYGLKKNWGGFDRLLRETGRRAERR